MKKNTAKKTSKKISAPTSELTIDELKAVTGGEVRAVSDALRSVGYEVGLSAEYGNLLYLYAE